MWVLTEKDSESATYYARIPAEIHPGGGMTINESLFLKFPKAGRYPVRYIILSRTTKGEGIERIERRFDFVLE
jgi:hypothetical protein